MEKNPTLQLCHHNAGWQKAKKEKVHCCAVQDRTVGHVLGNILRKGSEFLLLKVIWPSILTPALYSLQAEKHTDKPANTMLFSPVTNLAFGIVHCAF